MCDVFDRVTNAVCKIVHRVNAPLVTSTMVMHVFNAVHGRVTHVHIWRSHVDFGSQSVFSVRKVTGLHAFKEVQVLLDATVAIRTLFADTVPSTSVFLGFFRGEAADVGFTGLNELDCQVV